MTRITLKEKQNSVKKTAIKLLSEYELTELEINAIIVIQGLILERIMKEQKK